MGCDYERNESQDEREQRAYSFAVSQIHRWQENRCALGYEWFSSECECTAHAMFRGFHRKTRRNVGLK
jgi:hypothetical protein